MIWLTWRQFRGSAVLTAAVLVVLAVVLAVTGPDLVERYSAGIAGCTPDDSCARFYDQFFDEYQTPFMALCLIVLLLPAIVGLFWGAPLLTRELEAGTHLLVWNQSVTRARWLTVKLGLVGLAAVLAAGLCGLAVTWWSDPLDKSAMAGYGLMDPLVFDARGIVPMGYAAFAFALGVTMGMLVRRTLPAMALTLVLFAVVQLAMPTLVRPHLSTPVTATYELGTGNVSHLGIPREGGGTARVMLDSIVPGNTGAWVLSSVLLDPSGRRIAAAGDDAAIPISTTSGPCAPQGMELCMAEINRLGYRQQAIYHPLARFWAFQWLETGIYALLTLGLTWLCFWWLRRRRS
ncbi:ABC transporter permease [Nonomuraea sp. NPDC004297]